GPAHQRRNRRYPAFNSGSAQSYVGFMLEHLKAHLTGKVIILGMGNPLRNDDAAGSLLAQRIKDKVPFTVWDAGSSPENYLGRIIKENPDNLVIFDSADFGACAGEYRVFDAEEVKTTNFFTTHNSSLALVINYLQSQIKTDIIILAIQPKAVIFGDKISPEMESALNKLESWFCSAAKKGVGWKKIFIYLFRFYF
ncbi:MAG: hydrogenase 3 maturation endopeptidase HyCI, partial [Candidatus Omnitrophota bacterium]